MQSLLQRKGKPLQLTLLMAIVVTSSFERERERERFGRKGGMGLEGRVGVFKSRGKLG